MCRQENPAVGTTQPRRFPKPESALRAKRGSACGSNRTKPDAQAGFVIEAVRRADRFALGNHMRALRLWGVSPSAMRLAINRLVASKAFAKSGARQYQAFKRAVPLLLRIRKDHGWRCREGSKPQGRRRPPTQNRRRCKARQMRRNAHVLEPFPCLICCRRDQFFHPSSGAARKRDQYAGSFFNSSIYGYL